MQDPLPAQNPGWSDLFVFRQVFEPMPVPYCLCSREGRVIEANRAWRTSDPLKSGKDHESGGVFHALGINSSAADRIAKGELEALTETMEGQSEDGGWRQWQLSQWHPDGTACERLLLGIHSYVPRKDWITQFNTLQAEYAQVRQELLETRETAAAAARTRSAFISNVSDELRTPLNAILGFTQLLGADTTLGQTQREQIHSIAKSGDELLARINAIIDISKIVSAPTASTKAHRRLATLTPSARSMHLLLSKDHHLAPDIPPEEGSPNSSVSFDREFDPLHSEIIDAARSADIGRLTQLMSLLKGRDAGLAALLWSSVEQFDYEKLIQTLTSVTHKSP